MHTLIVMCLFALQSTAQTTKYNRDSLIRVMMHDEATLNGRNGSTFTAVKGKPGAFENQGHYHSAYFQLHPDSSFDYYRVFEGGYKLTLGIYKVHNGIVSFTWDSVKTAEAVKDKAIYSQYFKYASPSPRIMKDLNYRLYADSLVYIPE